MIRITIDEVTAQPWNYSASQYQYASGVHQPHIAEISPMQYANLSKSGRKRYDDKRSNEWQASIDIKQQWANAVMSAFDAGTITLTTPMHEDALHMIRRELRHREEEQAAETKRQAMKSNLITSKDQVTIGQRIYTHMGGYAFVRKINQKSISAELDSDKPHMQGSIRLPFGGFYFQNPREIVNA